MCFFNRGGERNDSNGLIIEFLGFKKYPIELGGGSLAPIWTNLSYYCFQGLMPKRNKLQRNPRVKNRVKFEKAKKRRKGAVREVNN